MQWVASHFISRSLSKKFKEILKCVTFFWTGSVYWLHYMCTFNTACWILPNIMIKFNIALNVLSFFSPAHRYQNNSHLGAVWQLQLSCNWHSLQCCSCRWPRRSSNSTGRCINCKYNIQVFLLFEWVLRLVLICRKQLTFLVIVRAWH